MSWKKAKIYFPWWDHLLLRGFADDGFLNCDLKRDFGTIFVSIFFFSVFMIDEWNWFGIWKWISMLIHSIFFFSVVLKEEFSKWWLACWSFFFWSEIKIFFFKLSKCCALARESNLSWRRHLLSHQNLWQQETFQPVDSHQELGIGSQDLMMPKLMM